jgi:hypothetical protein
MLTYAGATHLYAFVSARYRQVSPRLLVYADVCRHMLTYAAICWRMLTFVSAR